FKEQKLVVIGSDAMAVFDDGEPWERKLLLFPHRLNLRGGMPNPLEAEATARTLQPSQALQDESQQFLDLGEGRATRRTDGGEGLRMLSGLTRASASLKAPAVQQPVKYKEAKPSASDRFPRAKIHESAYVDDDVEIGDHTSIWHFSHVLSRVRIGPDCVIGQNVVIGPDVTIGKYCKIQNNVSVYKGVT